MTTESKAREFLLKKKEQRTIDADYNAIEAHPESECDPKYIEAEKILKHIRVIEKSYADKLQSELKAKDELLRECEKALAFYADENKWFMRTKIIDPSKDVIFASRYNDKTGQSEAVDIKEPFESKSYEVTARLKIDQGKTAQAMLQKLREGNL